LHLKKATINKMLNGSGLKHRIHLDHDEREKTLEGGSIGKFFKKMGNKVKDALTPRNIAHVALHNGLPMLTATLGTALAPELGPVGGIAGSVAGSQIANVIGKKTGLGLKGSEEMKEKMAKIRAGKGLGKNIKKAAKHTLSHVASYFGKKVANHAIDGIAGIANSYGYHIPDPVKNSIKMGADYYIDGRRQDAMNAIKDPVMNLAQEKKQVLKEQIQRQVDKLPIQVQPYVQDRVVSLGFGLKKKHERILKGGTMKISRRGKKMYNNNDFHLKSEETFSPYLNTDNPAQTPYIPMVNSFTHQVPLKSGNGLFGPGQMSGHGFVN
jgi:hypothetical protein